MNAALLQMLVAAISVSVEPSTDHALDSLAAAVVERTSRYHDRQVAIADGYRRIGTDFPGMGEHWLHPGMLLSGRIDANRPTILSYASIAGRPTLLGVGFVRTTRGNEDESTAPAPPGWPETWHEHSGLLSDESGADPSRPRPSDAGTRVWVLHIWTALPNPSGPYVPDNWSLPLARLGLAGPAHVDPDGGRAAALAVEGGDRFLLGLLDDAGLLTKDNVAAVETVVARARASTERVVAQARVTGRVDAMEMEALRATWTALAGALRAAIGPSVDRLLAPPHPHPGQRVPRPRSGTRTGAPTAGSRATTSGHS